MPFASTLNRCFTWNGCVVAAVFITNFAVADSITVNGNDYHDVVVRESPSLYFIATPKDGKAFSVPKSEVDASTISMSTPEERKALQTTWEANARIQQALTTPVEPKSTVNNKFASDGTVRHIKMKDVPLRDALDATLRPLNLDYQVNDNYLFITTPDRVRQETTQVSQVRSYGLRGIPSDTLPKIVVQNPAAPSGLPPGGGGAFGGGAFGGGGMAGGGGIGVGQFGGGGGGLGGGIAGGGGLGGGQGFGGGAGGGPVFISNISQLFSTIDDRLVGETPAVIGMSVSGGPTPVRNR